MIDIAIIGGGPAGLAAGLYAARSGLRCILFEEIYVGGQITKTHLIENYPGFPEGIGGVELGMNLEKQAVRFGMELRYEPVERLELTGREKHIVCASGIESARTVILTTGASPKMLGVEGESALTGAGVSYCATCDGALFRGKDVAVIGGGDTAVSDAIYLARFANKVTVIHRRDRLRAAKTLQDRAFAEKKIDFLWNSAVTAFCGEGNLSHLEVENRKTGEKSSLPVKGAFVAVGISPRTDLVKDQLKITPEGYVHTDAFMRTSLSGVYAAGDVRNTPLRQVVTAVADGAIAATQAIEYLSR